MCGFFVLGLFSCCMYLAGHKRSFQSVDPELSLYLCVINWCGQKEGESVENEAVMYIS